MIEVTRLNGEKFWINPHQIETIEKTPDTILTLMSGRKVVLKDSIDELRRQVVEYRRRIAAAQEL